MEEKETTSYLVRRRFVHIYKEQTLQRPLQWRTKKEMPTNKEWKSMSSRPIFVCLLSSPGSTSLCSRHPTSDGSASISFHVACMSCRNVAIFFYFVLFVVAPLSAGSICQHFVCQSSCAIIASLPHYYYRDTTRREKKLFAFISLCLPLVAFHITS